MSWDEEDLAGGPVPLWFQISQRLLAALEDGDFVAGDVLPSEAELCRRFSVSRTTARTALDSLAERGLIERRSGRGSIVLPPRVEQPLNLLASFHEDMQARGLTPAYRDTKVDVRRPRAEVSSELDVVDREVLVCISRVLLADGTPIGESESWLAPHVADPDASLPGLAAIGSLYDWIEETSGHRIALGREVIEAGIADAELAKTLATSPGSAVLIARRTACDERNVPIEYAIRHYRADRYRYRTELVRR